MILNARKMLNGNTEPGDCCVCGGKTDGQAFPIQKVLSSNFTNFDGIIKSASGVCCKNCQNIIKDRAVRTKCLACTTSGVIDIIDYQKIMYIIENPPTQFVISVPYSFKKHHWLYAGLSTPQKMYIGTDNKTIVYEKAVHEKVKDAVIEMIKCGVPTTQIINGNYHPSVILSIGQKLNEMEECIKDFRAGGLVELLVKVAPKEKYKDFIGDDILITKSQEKTALYLKFIAVASEYRKKDGKAFWGGIFEARVNRVVSYNFAVATNKLLVSLDCNEMFLTEFIKFTKSLSEREEKEIMETLKNQSKICIALAYAELKKEREK